MPDALKSPETSIENISGTTSTTKSKRLNYEYIRERCNQAKSLREQLPKSQTMEIQEELENFIEEIKKLDQSASKYLDADEVMSDLEWITEYYEKKEWNNVTRWLSNIDSSLREMWSDYIEKILINKNAEQKNSKH